jgi:20S proteasome alpha/beta subunit
MPPIVFSPTGRLHPVEAAFRASKAVTPLSNLLVAMRCRDGLVVMSTLPVSPHVDARIATSRNTNTHAHTHTAAGADGADDNTTRTDTSSSNDNDNDTSEHSFDGTGNATSASTTNNETANDDDDDDDSLYPSLFLFDETCTSTVTGPIFDIHPCIVGATAGNAVDNRIMRTKLLALGLNALEHQGASEEDVTPGRVAKDLANQLQVVTQDIAAAQKQKLGRMLAVSREMCCALLCCGFV